MKNSLIIHGYCNNVMRPWKKEFSLYGELYGLYEFFKCGKLDIFKWGIQIKPNIINFLNPLTYIKLYKEEKNLTTNKELQQNLYNSIQGKKYEIVVAHSMGTVLLFNTLELYGVPESLKKIITVQADLDNDIQIKNSQFLSILENNKLVWENYYNPKDPQLIVSTIINRKKRLGLIGTENKMIKNHYHKLGGWNRHIYSINNKEFIKKLCDII